MVPSALWMMTSACFFLASRFAFRMAVSCNLWVEVMRWLPSRRTAQPFSCGTTCWCQVLGRLLARELLKKTSTSSIKIVIQDLEDLFAAILQFIYAVQDTVFVVFVIGGRAV